MASQIKGLQGFYWIYPSKDNPWGEKVSTRTAYNPSTGEKLTVRQAQTSAHGGVSFEKRKADKQEPKQKITGGGNRPVKQPKPVLPVAQRRKISRPHVQNMYRKSDVEKKRPIGKAVNARSEDTLQKQISKLPDNAGVLFHIINTKTGEEMRAVGPGKGSTVNAGDLKQAITNELASGKSYKDALRAALSNLFTFYGTDPVTGIRTSEELENIPDDVTNFVMYTIY